MKNTIRIITAMILIIGFGLVHGSWTNRWGPAPALAALASRIETLPTTIGDWSVSATRELPPSELAMTGAVGSLSRVYTNPAKRLSVSVLLLSGLPGKISTHTPDACYPGAGYSLGNPDKVSRRYGNPEHTADFQTAVASRTGTNPSVLRLYWAWFSSKGWSSPEDARWSFAAEPMLTKLYVVRETGGVVGDAKDDPGYQFLSDLLPELERILFPPESAASAKLADSRK